MKLLLLKMVVYGHAGMVLEVWFTGLRSLSKYALHRFGLTTYRDQRTRPQDYCDRRGTPYSSLECTTYLWSLLVYGTAALAFEGLRALLHLPYYAMAPFYLAAIYVFEYGWGWALRFALGHCPWQYEKSPWSPQGLINLKYLPYWGLVALCFDPIARALQWAISILEASA